MPEPVVLQLDLQGTLPANLIENEPHVLNETTGRIFALNYGGFYSASVVIVRDSDNYTLIPGVDFVAMAPNDAITKQTGLESMSVLALTKETDFDDTYNVTYQAVGGDYSTNVDVVRDVIQAISQDTGTVEWGLILNKPLQFNAAPHLIDFRTQLFGFEGLIESIQGIISKMVDPSPSQIQAVLNTVNSGLVAYKSGVNLQLANMQTQINALLNAMPNVSGFFSGTGATEADIKSATGANKVLTASTMSVISNRANTATPLLAGETVDNTTRHSVIAVVNIAATMSSTGSVPNASLPWHITTYWNDVPVGFTPATPPVQIAQCLTAVNGTQVVLRRIRGVTAWDRIDVAGSPAARFPVAVDNDLSWDTASGSVLMTALGTKRFMEINVNAIIPIGGIIVYAANENLDADMLRWWQYCRNNLLDVSSYQALFNKIGYLYGGSGATFRTPDLRGVVVRGYDNGGDPETSRDRDRMLAEINDGFSHFGRYQADEFKGHNHHSGHPWTDGPTNRLAFYGYTPATEPRLVATSGSINYDGLPNTSESGGWESRMKNLALNYLIRAR